MGLKRMTSADQIQTKLAPGGCGTDHSLAIKIEIRFSIRVVFAVPDNDHLGGPGLASCGMYQEQNEDVGDRRAASKIRSHGSLLPPRNYAGRG